MSITRATVKRTPWELGMNLRGRKRERKSRRRHFSPPDHSRRMCTSTFLSSLFLNGNDEFLRWKSLFFYRCTDDISYAPLKSQGVDFRSKYISENTVAAAPPPCSPKSIYALASWVRQPSTGLFCAILTRYIAKARNSAPL